MTEFEGRSDMGSTKVRKSLGLVNRVAAAASIILLAVVIANTIWPSQVTIPTPSSIPWYGLALSFLLWFSTRKGGCGSCNQGACS